MNRVFRSSDVSQPAPAAWTPASTMELCEAAETEWDVVVIGAGLAGGLAAERTAARGLRTLLVEKSSLPRYKVCGGCLNGSAMSVLREAGLEAPLRACGAPALQGMELVTAGRRARVSLPSGCSVSRELLDALLAQAAVDAGAELLMEARAALQPHAGDDRLRRVTLSVGDERRSVAARVVLLATGLAGPHLGTSATAAAAVAPGSRIGAGCLTEWPLDAFPTGWIQMAVDRHGYLGAARVEGGKLNLAAAVDPEFVHRSGGLGPALLRIARQAGLELDDRLRDLPWRGTPLLTRRSRFLAARRLLVLGDAAGYVEPFTGEGMAWALASGVAAAALLRDLRRGWEPDWETRWTAVHRQTIRRRQWLCRGIAWWLRSPARCRWAMSLLQRWPDSAQPVVRRLNHPYRLPV